jgi:LacI family transcriptional regulator
VIYVAEYHQLVSLPDRHGIAELVIANGFDRDGTPAVVPDDYSGQRNLVARLIESGHRRIAYMTLAGGLIATVDRTRGWRDAHGAAGLAADPTLVRESESFHAPAESRRRTMEFALSSLLALSHPPTVICAGNDRLAMQVYGMLRSRGLRVPEDISVAGYDDHRLISDNLYPPLTSVELPYHQMGMAAAGILLKRLNGDEVPSDAPLSVPGEVKWRDSVIAPSNTTPRTQANREEKT